MEPVDDFAKTLDGAVAGDGDLALFSDNLVASGSSTRSEVVVDGRNAYLPYSLSHYVTDPTTVPAVTVSTSRLSNGNLSIAETDPLRSCAGNVYPQSTGTCTPVATGVALKRTIVTSVQGAVVTVQDRFVDVNDHAHSLNIEYFNDLPGADYGEAGVRLPGASSFVVPTPNTTKTNLPAGPNTMFLTSDLHATDGEPNRADLGVTYSGRPTVFFASKNTFGLRYSRHISKNGSAGFGFALETGYGMSTVSPLATAAQQTLTDQLVITAPNPGAHVGSPTTVKGTITNPVNGLPATVSVASGSKHTTATVSATGKWDATLSLTAGKHKITAKTTDPSGRKLRSHVHVHVS
jgi:Glucodextranase, domain B